MAEEAIKVFCRVRPVLGESTTVEYDIDNEDANREAGTIEFYVPDDYVTKHSQNMNSSYKFAFNRVFDQDAQQQDVYEQVARPVVENALDGYNGTIFVYGQTATGKTYTITGEDTEDDEKPKGKNGRKKRKQRQSHAGKPKTDGTTRPEQSASTRQVNVTTLPHELEDIAEEVGESTKDGGESTTEKNAQEIQEEKPPSPVRSIPSRSGIVVRTLSHIFSYLEDYEAETEIKVSYYEIYKESGYDLLNGKRGSRRINDIKQLPQVKAMTDRKHKLHLKNLSFHEVDSETQALELLEHGNANRQVAETHLNQASSRSHCIFTINLTIKHPETETILRPKIHLVDLAGSERIGKSHQTDKRLLSEGRNINLSLHHLQQVIISLSKKKATLQHHKHHHVPYRNSTMTLVLSDSLGGNSYTSMIATVSAEVHNLEESISTCRFAQQVATIANKVVVNQIEDADLVIARLRQELQETKRQLVQDSPLSNYEFADADFERLEDLIQEYLEKEEEDAVLDVENDKRVTQYCFKSMKERLLDQLQENRKLQQATTPEEPEQLKSQPKQKNNSSKACAIL